MKKMRIDCGGFFSDDKRRAHCKDQVSYDLVIYIIEALKTALQEKLFLTKETIDEFLSYFVSTLPDYIKLKLSVVSCESRFNNIEK